MTTYAQNRGRKWKVKTTSSASSDMLRSSDGLSLVFYDMDPRKLSLCLFFVCILSVGSNFSNSQFLSLCSKKVLSLC